MLPPLIFLRNNKGGSECENVLCVTEMVNSGPGKGEVCTATSAMIALHRASQQLDVMEQLEEELTCPICCSLFEDPRVLLCSHSFCKKCLEGLLEGNRGAGFRTPLKCPTCRKETPHNGANSLQVNYSLSGIVEKYSKIRVMPKMSFCKQHFDQPLNMFCATDLKLICGFCATTLEHRGHTFSSLEEACTREKEAFQTLLDGVKSWRSADALSCLETLQTNKKKALRSLSKDAETVTDYFDQLVSSLEGKKNEILCDLEALKLVVMQAYDPEIAKLSAALEDQRVALSIADSFRSVSEPLLFLQKMQEFREKLRVLKETPQPSLKDTDFGPFTRNVDVKKWDSVKLREVDRISVSDDKSFYRAGVLWMTRHKWKILMSLCLILLILRLKPCSLTAYVTSQREPIHTALSSHITCPVYLQEMIEICKQLIGSGQERLKDVINSFVILFH